MLQKKISDIEFRVMGPEFIRRLSAVEIKNPETYDKDGYPIEGGLMDPHLGVINPGLRCKTCGHKMKACAGHFGSLEMVRPVINPLYGKKIDELLQSTCQQCGRIALPEEGLKELSGFIGKPGLTKVILTKTKKAKKCPHCKAKKSQITLDKPTNFFIEKERLYPTQIREWVEKIPEKDLILFGYNTDLLRPEWFVMTVLQVPPITIRPSITLESGIRSEDDLTHKLVDIIRINQRLKDNIDAGAPQLIIEDLWDLLQYHVTTYLDNNISGVPPARHRSGRALRTVVQRLKGKRGRFRFNLIGKRVNFAARSTISPDPFLSVNEIGVPEYVADTLTVPEKVSAWNKDKIKKKIKEGKIEYVVSPTGLRKKLTDLNKEDLLAELDEGFRTERKIEDGDIILFNRQPSLHRMSMMAHNVRILPGRTFRMNPTVCKPYNADFDGDEMNAHVPQTPEGITEAKELMLAEKHILSPRHGGPVIIADEDGVSAAFILTLNSRTFSKKEAMNYLYKIGIEELPKPDSGDRYSGKLLFSQLLPKDLNIEYKTKLCRIMQYKEKCATCLEENCKKDAYVKIKNGKLLTGVIDEESLGEGNGRIIVALTKEYPSSVIKKFYTSLSIIGMDLISKTGFTTGLDEFIATDSMKAAKNRIIKEVLEESEELVKKYRKGKLDLIPGRSLDESFEIQIMRMGMKKKEKLQKKILVDKIDEILGEEPKVNTMVMIVSGARGRPDNLTNLIGLWGQVSVREGRPKRGYRDRLITNNKVLDVGAKAGGFVTHSLMEGLKAKEYFYHAMGGRQGEVDTGVSTKISGYLYRRFANALKDLTIKADGSVRNASNEVLQLKYGEDGVFPSFSQGNKTVDVEREYYIMEAEGK